MVAETVVGRALEREREKALVRAREFLCKDCPDRRCLNNSICKAFVMLVESFAWEEVAKQAELN